MSINLEENLRARLQRLVDTGQLPSVDEAVNLAVIDMMSIADDTLEWARPYLDAGRRDIAEGRLIDGDDIVAWLHNEATT